MACADLADNTVEFFVQAVGLSFHDAMLAITDEEEKTALETWKPLLSSQLYDANVASRG